MVIIVVLAKAIMFVISRSNCCSRIAIMFVIVVAVLVVLVMVVVL